MAINPIHYAMVQRTNDVSALKHNEDAKPLQAQQNIQVQVDKREDVLRHQVLDPNHSDQTENHADAREEGKGKYVSGTVRRKKSKAETREACVVRKQERGGFDISI